MTNSVELNSVGWIWLLSMVVISAVQTRLLSVVLIPTVFFLVTVRGSDFYAFCLAGTVALMHSHSLFILHLHCHITVADLSPQG